MILVEQQAQPGARVEAKMIPALRTDVPVGVEVLFPNDLAAAVALGPQTLGADVRAVRRLDALFFSPKPGHRKPVISG